LHTETQVLSLGRSGNDVTVKTSRGSFTAARVILAAGAWNPAFMSPALARRLTVTRQSLHWFEPPVPTRDFEPSNMPVFIWNDLYGFPIAEAKGGVKIATETLTAIVDPDGERKPANEADLSILEPRVRASFPRLGAHMKGATCLYTSTPDFNFWAGPHPENDKVTVVSACSGHGFKHAAAIGEAVAMEALGRHATPIPKAWREFAKETCQ